MTASDKMPRELWAGHTVTYSRSWTDKEPPNDVISKLIYTRYIHHSREAKLLQCIADLAFELGFCDNVAARTLLLKHADIINESRGK